jgi:CRISPR/Cas system-associated exonuclease Cas4 (RecB family)
MKELLPLSLLNDFLYCPRRAALKIVEGWRSANEHTARGDIVHEHADLPGYEVAKGVTLLRALPVWSERLGLSGKCDIVEVHPAADEVTRFKSKRSDMGDADTGKLGTTPHVVAYDEISETNTGKLGTTPHVVAYNESSGANFGNELEPPHARRAVALAQRVGCHERMVPVEFKLGKRRKWENDDAQLCAQALCLEEMFSLAIPRGAVFHADSKRRRDVEFTTELRQRTEEAVGQLHALLGSDSVPPAEFREACQECSLFEICLPKATGAGSRAAQLAGQLFKI